MVSPVLTDKHNVVSPYKNVFFCGKLGFVPNFFFFCLIKPLSLGTPVQSPIHTHHRSPLATHGSSHSPSAPPNHSPFTQSTESQSGEKDQQPLQFVVVPPNMIGDHNQGVTYPILPVASGCSPYQSSISDCHMGAIIPGYTPYHTPGIPRTIYLSPPYVPANFPYPVSHGPPFHHGQSRPSSHSSDQSDASTMSISSDGKGES